MEKEAVGRREALAKDILILSRNTLLVNLRFLDLALSCFALACELATRFLADYIVGDKYFKIKEPEHNLIRTRCQIALAKDMLRKMDAMNAIVQDCAKRYKAK